MIFCVSKKLTFAFSSTRFFRLKPTAKVSEGTNRNMPARNTLVELLALNTDPESHNALRYRQTDGDTDDIVMQIADDCVTIRSAKKAMFSEALECRAKVSLILLAS